MDDTWGAITEGRGKRQLKKKDTWEAAPHVEARPEGKGLCRVGGGRDLKKCETFREGVGIGVVGWAAERDIAEPGRSESASGSRPSDRRLPRRTPIRSFSNVTTTGDSHPTSIPSPSPRASQNRRSARSQPSNPSQTGCSSLASMPTAVVLCLCNLEKLLLAGCDAFKGLNSFQLRLLAALDELDISGCGALKDVKIVSFQDLPKLRALNLSHTKIAHLSITRCASLEMVRLQGLTNLKSLHLSSIKIKELPHEISELTHLEELHLSDVKQLRRVEWEKEQWLPEKLEWDECGCCSSSKPPAANNLRLLLQLEEELGGENRGGAGGAFISVSNGNVFKGLSNLFSALGTELLEIPFLHISLSETRGEAKKGGGWGREEAAGSCSTICPYLFKIGNELSSLYWSEEGRSFACQLPLFVQFPL